MGDQRRVAQSVTPQIDKHEMGVWEGCLQKAGEREHPYGRSLHAVDEEDAMFPQPEGDAEGGYSYHGASSVNSRAPLASMNGPGEDHEHEPLFDGDEELERIQHQSTNGNGAQGQTELVPYAHRDLKPGYVGMNSV